MNFEKSRSLDDVEDWIIPNWLKVFVAGSIIIVLGLLVRVLLGSQQSYFDISVHRLAGWLFCLLLGLSAVSIGFGFHSKSAFSLLAYWLMRWLREPARILSLLGIVYLLVVSLSLTSWRAIGLYILLLVLLCAAWSLRPLKDQTLPHPAVQRFLLWIRRLAAGYEAIPPWILQLIVALLPIAIVCFVIYFVFGSKLSNYGPYGFWNDETSYWVWLRSFHFVGLNSGYNAPNEVLAPFEFSRYGEASPFYLYIYGPITKLAGWFDAFPVLINFVLLAVATYCFFRITKFDHWQIACTGLAIIFTWPVLFYLPITSHETLNQAIGILLAAFFIKLLKDGEHLGWGQRILLVLFVYLATLVRLSWGLMFIPLLFYCLKGNLWKRMVFAVLLGGILFASAIVLIGEFLPPLNNSIFITFRSGIGPALGKVLNLILPMLAYRQFNPNFVVMFQMLVIMGWSLAHLWQRFRARQPLDKITADPSAFDFFNMSSLLVAGLTFYLPVAFYRTFAPAMLMVYLLLVMRRYYDKLVTLLVINALFFSGYMYYLKGKGDYKLDKLDYTATIPSAPQIQAQMEKYITYDPNAQTPWCNTLFIPLEYYHSRLMLVPPGIGISYILDIATYRTPIKSRYVWLDADNYEQLLKEGAHLEKLTALMDGTLYLNQDVQCQPVP